MSVMAPLSEAMVANFPCVFLDVLWPHPPSWVSGTVVTVWRLGVKGLPFPWG